MALRDWLEETWADVNPFDNGKTGATIRAARGGAKPAPARTPKANTARPQIQRGNQMASPLQQEQPQSRVSKVEVPRFGVTNAAAPLSATPSLVQKPVVKPNEDEVLKQQSVRPELQPAFKQLNAKVQDVGNYYETDRKNLRSEILKGDKADRNIVDGLTRSLQNREGEINNMNSRMSRNEREEFARKTLEARGQKFDTGRPVVPEMVGDTYKAVTSIVRKPMATVMTALNKDDQRNINSLLNEANQRFRSGKITQRRLEEEMNNLIGDQIDHGLKVTDQGIVRQSGGEKFGSFAGGFTDAGVNAASVLPVARGAKVGMETGKQTLAQIAKNAAIRNAKETAVYGTSSVVNDVVNGREVTPMTVATNFAAPFALGAASEVGVAAAGRGLSKLSSFMKNRAAQAPTPVETPSLQPAVQAEVAPRVAPEAPVAKPAPVDNSMEIAQLEDHLRKHGTDGNYSQENFEAQTRLAALKQENVDQFVAGRTERIPLKEGQKYSKFANDTVQGSDEVSAAQKKLLRDEQVTYDTVTNAGRAEEATRFIDSLPKEKAFGRVIKDLENPKALDGGQKEFNAIELAKRLDAEIDEDSLAMSTEIYRKLSENASKKGQEIQALSYLNNRTPQGLLYGAARDLDKAGIKVTPEIKQQLKSFTDEIAKHPMGSDARNFAIHQMSQFVTSKIPVGIAPKIINFWRAGLLTAPTTTGGNILGNTGETVVRKAFVDPVAELSDRVMSVVTGKRSYASNGGFAAGAKEGAGKLKRFVKTGYDERNALSKYDSGELNYGEGKVGTAIGKYVNGTYRLMSLADQPFWYGARNEALSNLAKVDGINQGLKGADLDAHINNILDNPPTKLMEQATKEAKYATFQNETMLGSVAGAIKQGAERYGGDTGRAIADFFIPFTQVPASIATRVIQRTPVGTGAEIVKQIINTRNGKPFDQRAMAKAIGEGSFGSAVFAGGYALANSGMLTFGYPEDQKERELWEAEGKQPYSVRVGDRWYSLNYIQPFGTLLAVGGEAANAVKDGADAASAISRAIATAGQAVMNQSFLKGISGVLDAIDDPKRYAENYVSNTAGSIVPNFIRALARASDGTQREQKGALEGIQGSIPLLRNGLPAKQDTFGQDLPAKDSFVNQYLNPLRPSKVRGEEVTAELRRLQDAGLGILPTSAKKDTFKDTELTREQVSEINRRTGLAMKDEYGKLIASPEYQALSDEQKSDSLKKINDTVFGAIKAQYADENGIAYDTKLDKSQKRYLTGNTVNFLSKKKSDGSSADGIEVAETLQDEHRQVLGDYDVMTQEERDSWFNEQPDAEYKYTLAKALNQEQLGKLSKADIANLKTTLAKAKAGSTFKKETRDLYGLSKAELWDLVSNDPDGQRLADEVVAYGDALADAGLGKNKFRNSKGGVAIQPSSGKGGSGGRGGSKKGKSLDYKMDGYLNTASTAKSLRDILKEAQISKPAKRPA